VPADRFNPDGYTEATFEATAELTSSHRNRGRGREPDRPRRQQGRPQARAAKTDARGNWRRAEMPQEGDSAAGPLPFEELTWTFECDGDWKVR
jgi:hypothetical protein